MGSEVARLGGGRSPIIVAAVLVFDRSRRKLRRRCIVQAGEIDGIEGAAQHLRMAPPEGLDAAAAAEEMVNDVATELIVRQRRFALQQPEGVRRDKRLPESLLAADRAV